MHRWFIKNIELSKTNEKIKKSHASIKERSKVTCELVKRDITVLDNIVTTEDGKSYENGCNFLLSCFN